MPYVTYVNDTVYRRRCATIVIWISRAWRTTCCTIVSPNLFHQGRAGLRPTKIWVTRWARANSDAARYVLTFYYVRLDTQVTREAHVALDGFADALGRGYVNRQTIGAEVVRHALAAADEVGRGRAAGEADEDALIAPGRHQPLFGLVGGVADGELAERGEVGLGEEVVERAAGLLGGVDHAALDAIAQGLGRE